MPELQELTMLQQKEIERQFAAIAYHYPLYTLQQCGWMQPSLLLELKIRKFWAILSENLEISMSDDQAASIATQAALEADITGELITWERSLPHSPMPQAYANEIQRRRYLTGVSSRLGDIFKKIQSGDDLGVREILSELHGNGNGGKIYLQTADEVGQKFEQILTEGNGSISTFIPPMDVALGGLERKTLNILAGRPGMGKTALGLQIARNVAVSGSKVIFFSLEMGGPSLWARMACPLADTTWRDYLAGRLSATKIEEVRNHSAMLRADLGALYIPDNRQTTDTIWRAVANTGPELVVIDHLRFVKDKAENENKRQGMISEALHDMAKAFDIPVLALVQLNRSVEKQMDKRPQLSDLRDSGEIEENADNVMMMYRDSYYNPENNKTTFDDVTEIWLRKFRNGPPNVKVNLRFDMKKQWFEAAL